MVPDPSLTSLGMEYFCFEGDGIWSATDYDLAQLAIREAEQIGLIKASEVKDAFVVRMPKAYPMYDNGWLRQIEIIRGYLQSALPNLQLVGRNGMHKYNNQDHSMMTALCAVRNIQGAQFDLWAINSEPEYHEEKTEAGKNLEDLEARRPAYAEPPLIPRPARNVKPEPASAPSLMPALFSASSPPSDMD